MNALLIAPSERLAVANLAEGMPLVIAPFLGKPLAAYWLEHLVFHGVKRVRLLAVDRPHEVRAVLGDGSRWGLILEVVPEHQELTSEEARQKYRSAGEADWLPAPLDAAVIDHLPGLPEQPLFTSYAARFAALTAWVQRPASPDRIGSREIRPGVWVGLRSHISAGAQLHAPCWIGEYVMVGRGAVVGPGAIVEDRVLIGDGARIVHSAVGPETFVGTLTLVEKSLARDSLLINWATGSSLRVPDAFLLAPLPARAARLRGASFLGRALALLALVATAPGAGLELLFCRSRGEPLWRRRTGMRAVAGVRSPLGATFTYGEFPSLRGWARRWPQLWSIVRGDLVWIGNRPLQPGEALRLANDFERLGLTAPVGLISLADAEGCPAHELNDVRAHASFYAACSNRRLRRRIFLRAFRRTLTAPAYRPSLCDDEAVSFRPHLLKPQG